MAKKFLVAVDLGNNNLVNASIATGSIIKASAKVENASSAPSAAGAGSLYYNTSGALFYATGSGTGNWVQLATGSSAVSSVNSITGAITLSGTTNQVTVTNGSGTITLSTPQDIATTSKPQFAAIGIGTSAPSAGLTVSGGKATFAAPASGYASAILTPAASDPTTLAIGDIWVNGTALKFSTGTTSGGVKTVAFTDSSITGSAGSVANAVTFNNGGSGAASGSTFNGSSAVTISYNTVGAAASSHTHTVSNITDISTTYAALAGATFTGNIAINNGTSTAITTSGTTAAVFNTTATTLNIGGAATTVSIGASSGTTTVNNDLAVTGNLTVSGTTTNLNSTNLVIEDKNIIIADVATPTNTTADGAGITIKGATDKTFNWVNATSAFTSSENLELAAGKTIALQGSTSGKITLTAPATAGTGTITFPASTTGTVITTGDTGTVTNTMLAGSIADTKLSTISTAGKVSNSATTATSANTASAIVARDSSGNFSAGTITATLSGNASTATALATARNINGTAFDGTANITITANTTNALSIGTGLTGTSFNGSASVSLGFASGSTAAGVSDLGSSYIYGVQKASATITGNASKTSWSIAHNLNSRDIQVRVYQTSSTPDTQYADVEVDIVRTSAGVVTITFASAPALNDTYNVVMVG